MKVKVEKLTKVRVNPGDVVVLRFGGDLSPEVFEFATQKLKEYFPNNKTMVLSGDAQLEVYTGGAVA